MAPRRRHESGGTAAGGMALSDGPVPRSDPDFMSRPLRVLLVTASPERGGAETVVQQLLAGLDRSRIDPSVVALCQGPFVEELQAMKAAIVSAGTLGRMRNIGRGIGVINRLTAAIRAGSFDIVHSHGTLAHIIGGLAAWRARVP